jgi:hypothetical protein
MPTALRVPGLVRQPALVAQTVVRRRALAQWRPLRLESRIVLRPGRQTVLLERSAVVPGSPPAMRRVQSVGALARLHLPPALSMALPVHPLLQAGWHCPVLRERSVGARSLRARRVSSRVAEQTQPAWTGQRPAELERSDPA